MVTVIGIETRKNAQSEEFTALLLEGELEFVQSMGTGKMYATARRISIPTTFEDDAARKFIGKQLPGIIHKVEVEPYEYTTKKGDTIMLSHNYVYCPNPSNLEETILGGKPEM